MTDYFVLSLFVPIGVGILLALDSRKVCGRVVIWRILLALLLPGIAINVIEKGAVGIYDLFSFASWLGKWTGGLAVIWFTWLRPAKK